MAISQMVERASTYELENTDILEFCEQANCSIPEFCNQFALYIANEYSERRLSFEYCDLAMNYLNTYMVCDLVIADGEWLPEPAYSIYIAFDAGEFVHQGDDVDTNSPEKYTRPLIDEIIAECKIPK